MKSPVKILVVDDDPTMVRVVEYSLRRGGYETVSASDGQAALKHFYGNEPDLIILDIDMPGLDGWEVCQRIREISRVPIIMLTAQDTERDVVKGLDLGADDYILKPFRAEELLARVRANLRRAGQSVDPVQDTLTYSDDYLTVNLLDRRVLVEGEPLKLSPTEFRLLVQLVTNPGRVMSFERLLQAVWGQGYSDEVDYLRVYIGHLRRKIEEDPKKPRYLHTEYGVGYRFEWP